MMRYLFAMAVVLLASGCASDPNTKIGNSNESAWTLSCSEGSAQSSATSSERWEDWELTDADLDDSDW